MHEYGWHTALAKDGTHGLPGAALLELRTPEIVIVQLPWSHQAEVSRLLANV